MIFVGKLFPMEKADRLTYRRLYRIVRKYNDVCDARYVVFGMIMRNHIGREVFDLS